MDAPDTVGGGGGGGQRQHISRKESQPGLRHAWNCPMCPEQSVQWQHVGQGSPGLRARPRRKQVRGAGSCRKSTGWPGTAVNGAPSHGQRCHLGLRAAAPSAGVSAPVGIELCGLESKGNVETDRVLA